MAKEIKMPGGVEVEAATLPKTKEPKMLFLKWLKEWSDPNRGKGIVNGGEAICEQPDDQRLMLNPTTPYGHGNLLYAKFSYTMPKYHFVLQKVDEYIVVSPAYPEMYGRITAKKREVEGQIKAGLASAAQAVADFELLKHDERKYREILDYFNEGKKDEHVLRALFVDRVDAHTGEGYSMISMTKRWPTIITDFLRLATIDKGDRHDPKKIRKKLEISEAEATVLKTKNGVFEEWEKIFFPDIRDRYARVKNLVDARRKSIDEYRTWLMPYVSNMKMLREQTELDPSHVLTTAVLPWHKPNAWYGVRVWMWKMFSPEEVGKPGFVVGEIDPYDDFVKRHSKDLEKNYGVRIVKSKKKAKELKEKGLKDEYARVYEDDDIIIVDEMMKDWNEPQFYESQPKLNPNRYMYCFYDLEILSPLFKLEGGKEEMDDWNCMITPYVASQNVILLALLEIECKKRWLNKYVKELIGVREVEDKIRAEVEKRYNLEPEKKKRLAGARKFVNKVRTKRSRLGRRYGEWWIHFKATRARAFLKYFMRIGPYETVRNERLSKMYGRYMGSSMTDPFIKFIKNEIGKLSGVQPP
jgi:hypothetical protein